jgi:alpha-L-rhamnosidase/Glycosyl hydrolases family 2, sugar binding domain
MEKEMKYICSVLIITLIAACTSPSKLSNTANTEGVSNLEKGFVNPPDTIQTSVYWYWMSDNISKEGVVKDLYAMKKQGINRAFIGNIGYESTPYGKVKLFTDEWWDILHTALKTATELNIEIGIFNCPGWSQSGGPWIKPEQAMRYLTSSELKVKGGQKLETILKQPNKDFQDVRVVAFKTPKGYDSNLADFKPKMTASVPLTAVQNLMDKDAATLVAIPAAKEGVTIDFETDTEFTASSLVIQPAQNTMTATAELQIKENNTFRTLKTFPIDRKNGNLNVGFTPYGAVAVSIPATTSKHFRLVLSKISPKFNIAEITLSASPKIESYIEKTLAKMFQTPLPYWNEYQWSPQPEVADNSLIINPKDVQDISKFMAADGTLKWDVPAGDWVIMRMGMTPTGVTNSPSSPEGTGLEVDKMSKEHIETHFNAFLGEIIKRIPAADRKTWKVTVEDSYETGGQNWTDGMIEKFQKNYGYDPLPYLPTLQGKVVGNPDMSDRFLWDLRRFIADRVAYDYVAGLRDISNKHGLHTWLENYGHWGFPGEFLQYGGQSDEIGGEFWSEGELGNIENRAASSAAHIYGKTKVSAESCTAGGKAYVRYPEMMKQRLDRFFTEGINNTLLHVYITQPTDDKVPGINANFGNEFNRHNTWFEYLHLFTTYIKRTNFMLQQGKYVADVAYFIGEDAPKMTGITDPTLPTGYLFDYINGEVIRDRVTVKNGRLYLPDGMNYGLLVLPKLETMRPELLQKISDLVAQGATILGPAPKRSPSLQGFPNADSQLKKLAADLWDDIDGKTILSHKFGKGTVLSGMDMQTALNFVNIVADYDGKTTEPTLFIHRKTADADIYFISNQTEKKITLSPEFRINGKQPELWHPVTGTTRILTEFTQKNGVTTVPLTLDGLESVFIVFRKNAVANTIASVNFPEPKISSTITSPWTVSFDTKMRGSAQPVVFNELMDWTKSTDDNIKYYSGTAVYKNTFTTPVPAKGERIFLHLGDVKVMAKVKVNGIDVGGVWTAPWQVDITNAVKTGDNTVEISVVNTWVNRLIGDSKLPVAERKTWTSTVLYKPESLLQPSGLRGPVTVQYVSF